MRTIWITVVFLLISLQPLLAAEIKPGKINTASTKYQSEKLFYLFFAKDYLSLLEFANDSANTQDERDLAQFLLQLPALSEGKKKFSPSKFQLDDSALSRLYSIAYGNRKYEEAFTLSRMLSDGGDARYLEGMSLLSLGNLEDAGKALEQVLPDDPLFPYARMALAQKDVIRQNFDTAENGLRQLAAHPSVRNNGLSYKVRLLLGQILFERGLYSEALKEFISIPQDTPLYEEALLGQAWCYIKLEDYIKAIPLLEKTKMDILDPTGRETLITLGYCLIRSGSQTQAKQHFNKLLAAGSSHERELSKIIEDKTLRGKYITFIKDDVEPATEKEQRYLSYLRTNPDVKNLLSEISYLHTVLAAFRKTEKTIIDNESRFDNIKNGLDEMAGRIESEIAGVKDILLKADIPLNPAEVAQKGQKNNKSILIDDYLSQMFGTWRYSVDREISNETKFVAREILQELARDKQSRCFEDPLICHIASFIAYDKGNFDKTQIRGMVLLLDSILKDLVKARNGENIQFEGLLPGVRGNINNKINATNRTISTLKKVREATDFNIKEIEKVLKTTESILDIYALQSFTGARYEIEDFKFKVIAGINSIEDSAAKESRPQTSN